MKSTLPLTHLLRRVAASAAVLVGAAVGTLVVGTSAGASPLTHEFYLSIGASESVGFQPTILRPHGQRTRLGYANDLVAMEAADGKIVTLTQLGCPGESTTTMLMGGDRCQPGVSQVSRAVAFLQAHSRERGIVTIDLGFNDLHPCIHTLDFSPSCVSTQVATMSGQLSAILDQLQAAAGPGVTFVGLNHNDPFVAAGVSGHATEQYVDNSVSAFSQLNQALATVYTDHHIVVADVAQAFADGVTTRIDVPGLGTVPTSVARECALTWICSPAPFGPNLHANAAGYKVIAQAIEDALHQT